MRSAVGALGVALWGLIAVGTLIRYASGDRSGMDVKGLSGASHSDNVETGSSVKVVTGKVKAVENGRLVLEIQKSPLVQGSESAKRYSFELRDATIRLGGERTGPERIGRGQIVEVLYTAWKGRLIAKMVIDPAPSGKR